MPRFSVIPKFLFASTSLIYMVAAFLFTTVSHAAVYDVTPTDVTTRAVSAVWVSDEPVTSATIHVFTDIDGLVDVTSSLTVSVDSALYPPAHDQGIVKVSVSGLNADTDYYLQTETVSASGVFLYPALAPMLAVHTAVEATKVNPVNQPIVNDLIIDQITFPDGTTPAPGTLLLMEVAGLSAYPLTAFVGEGGFAAPQVVIDTNNFYGTDGRSLELQTDDVLKVTAFRGLICSTALNRQKVIGFRRTPEHLESPAITELESPFSCYASDTVCDNTVNILDVQFVLNSFDNDVGSCGYNPNADTINDGQINILDVQRVLNDFGNTVPNR